MGWSYYNIGLHYMILAFSLIGNTQANFNMQTSKKYDHYFFDLYHTAFANHLNDIKMDQNLELDLENYAKKKKSRGIVVEWFKCNSWEPQHFKHLQQHFLFAVRVARECMDPFQLLILMYVKYQAYLRAITYMNGAIIFPENYDKRLYCRAVAINLLNFSDVGTNDIIEKLQATLQMTYGSALTNKITQILKMWTTAVYRIWEKYVSQMKSDNFSENIGEYYQNLCADENAIIFESKIAMMSLFEGIKQSVVKPILPPKERLTLNFTAALNLWNKSQKIWIEHFETKRDEFQLKEMMIQYDRAEMRMYGELYDNDKELQFDDLKNLNSLVIDETSGIIKLAMIQKETGIIRQRKEKLPIRRKADWLIGKTQGSHKMLTSKTSWIVGHTQANFNMVTSKKYDHYFLHLYHAAFTNHLYDVSKDDNLEIDLENYAKQKQSRGIVKEWFKFNNWELKLRQHFLFAVRIAKESTDPFQLLTFIHVKYQAYLRAIVFMNGAIILPEQDDRWIYCKAIAINLLNFSDVGINGIYKKLQVALQMKYGSAVANEFTNTLERWATAAHRIWTMFSLQMKPGNSPMNTRECYQKLCDEENEIMIESRIAMMSLFEAIKQGVVEPNVPTQERLTLNFAAAFNLWDMTRTTHSGNFNISKDKFQMIEIMIQYDKAEMRMYEELNDINKEALNFDELKNLNSLVIDKTTGIIKLTNLHIETESISQNKEEFSGRMKGK